MKTYSCEKQDLYPIFLLDKENGLFLDVACGHPIDASNTYILEQKNWTGICIDIGDVEDLYSWSKIRKAKNFQSDATSEEFVNILRENIGDRIVDYLSLDVDVGGYAQKNLTHLTLRRVLEAGVRFRCATIEHESFKYGPKARDEMRQALIEKGYIMLFEGVTFPEGQEFEDWWVDPKEIDQRFLSIQAKNLNYNQAIEKLSGMRASISK